MKYKWMLAACSAMLPTLVSAQGLQVKDCRTLEAAGNFLGPDEVMADGLVCKIVKPKPTASAAAGASKKDSDPRAKLALLGIIDTKSQELHGKADAGPAGTPPDGSGRHAPGGPAVSESSRVPENATFEVEHAPSLGDVARAYQKSSRRQTAKKPEDQGAAEARATATPEVKTEVRTETTAPSLPVVPEQKTDIPVRAPAVSPAAAIDSKAEPTPTASASAAPAEAQPVAKTVTVEAQPALEIKLESAPTASALETPAVAEAQPATKTPTTQAEPSPEAKPDTFPEVSASTTPATEVSTPETRTGSFDAQEEHRADERPEVRAAMPAPEAESNSERPQEVKLGVFETPQESIVETKPAAPADPFGAPPEDVAIHEPRPGCAKIVSLGSMEKDRLVLAIPDWAMKWLEKNQKRFSGVCFADSPLPGVPNYLIVFFTVAPPGSPLGPEAKPAPPASTASGSSGGTFTTSFGSTWHYTYDNAATTTVTTGWTESVPHNQPSQTLYATAYTEQGIPISQHWPGEAKGHEKETSGSHGRKHDAVPEGVRIVSDLLGEIMADLAAH